MITTCRGLCTTGRERNTRSTYEPQKGQKDVLRSSFLCISCSELCFLCSFPVPLCKAGRRGISRPTKSPQNAAGSAAFRNPAATVALHGGVSRDLCHHRVRVRRFAAFVCGSFVKKRFVLRVRSFNHRSWISEPIRIR